MVGSSTPLSALRSKTNAGDAKFQPMPPMRVHAHDARVVLQLLEEIHHLATPGHVLATDTPRLNAAAKLYLDTRDTFEAIERKVEDAPPGRPKLLRKLSKRTSIGKDTATTGGTSSIRNGRSTPMGSPELTPRSSGSAALPDGVDDEPSDGVIDRIQDLFCHLGEQLGPSILRELKNRKLDVQAILHYARFLPTDYQWQAYRDARQEQVALAYRTPSPSSQSSSATTTTGSEIHVLKQRAEFIKEHIRKDVDTVCLFSPDGTLSTIFGDDVKADKASVSDKFESLVTDVYSAYLESIIDAQMARLMALSDYWQQQLVTARSVEPPFAQHFARVRKYRSKLNIFPRTMFTLDDRLAGLPTLLPGQVLKLLVADLQHLGVWWYKSVLSMTERDVSTIHTDESRGIAGHIESLDGHTYVPIITDASSGTGTTSTVNDSASRRVWKSGVLAKWIGHSLLVNNGKDSVWVEVTVIDVDDKRCKLALKPSLQNCADIASWATFLSLHEWVAIRDVRFMAVPLNPTFRVHVGQKFRDVLDVIQSVVVEISSIFPNDELNRKVGNALWRAIETSVSKGEHLYARYLRATLSQDVVLHRVSLGRVATTRPSLLGPTASVRSLVAAFENSALGASVASSINFQGPGPLSGAVAGSSSNRGERSGSIATKSVVGDFDSHGRYHPQPASARTSPFGTSRNGTMSPFEKLAHHLLEETETVGVCLQASNAALGRAFAQVLSEKLTKVQRAVQTRFERDDATNTLELVLAEYASACRFLYVWRICRHELDTMPRQARSSKRESSSTNNLHVEWLDRTFERMDATVVAMLHEQRHYASRAFFHEATSVILPGIFEQTWSASKPWFRNARCTYSVQFYVSRLYDVVEFMVEKVLPPYDRTLGVHDKLHDVAVWMVLDTLPCVAAAYETLEVSRARSTQYKIDVLYLVSGVYQVLRLLERIVAPRVGVLDDRSRRRPANEIRVICLRLLACAAVRVGPGDVVLDAVAAKLESGVFEQPLDTTAELEVHVNAIATSLNLHLPDPTSPRPVSTSPRAVSTHDEPPDDASACYAHSIFGAMELTKLGDVTLSWASLISRCSLPRRDLLTAVAKRHELGSWDFPALTDHDKKLRIEFEQLLERARREERRDENETPLQIDDDDGDDGVDDYGNDGDAQSRSAMLVAVATVSAQWTQLWDYSSGGRNPAQPERRAAHAMISFEDALYIYGGVGDSGTADSSDKEFGDTWRFDLLAQTWTKAVADTASAPPKRFHHTGALHSNGSVAEFVVFGGLSIAGDDDSNAQPLASAATQLPIVQYNDVWRLRLSGSSINTTSSLAWVKDPVSNATGAVAPTPRSEAGAVVHNGQMYVFGGIAYDTSAESAPVDTNELWRYNLSSCVWTLIAPANSVRPPKRFSHTVTLVTDANGAAYVVAFSGRRLESTSWTLLDDTWLYAIDQNQWIYVSATSSIARAYTSAVSIGSSGGTTDSMDMWFFGGYFKPKQGLNGYVYDDVVTGKIALSRLLSSDTNGADTTSTSTSVLNTDVNRVTPQSLAIASPVVSASMKMYYGLASGSSAHETAETPALRYNHRAAVWRNCMVIHGGSYQVQRGDVWLFNTTSARLRAEANATLPMDVETLVYVLGGFVVSILTILMVLLIRWRHVDRHQMEMARQRGETTAPRGVSQERLEQLAITKYKRPAKDVTAAAAPRDDCEASVIEDVCPICLIEFEDDEDVRNLPCCHIFHVPCIDEWFKRNTSCPMCKSNVDLDAVDINVEPTAQTIAPAPVAGVTGTAGAVARGTGAVIRSGAVVTPVLDA